MCGLTGALSFTASGFEVTEPFITRMRESLAHRGPDGAGTWISPDRRVGLGFRRLSILDLAPAASQPMASDDGSIHLCFNGEVYNHAELRCELTALGAGTWKTDHSDTEVLLKAFERWGIGCLERLRGMFAIAIWDATKRELWLARDRIGIKPLYYSVHHGRITFASEIKALLQDDKQRRAVNEEGLYHFLTFLTVPAPETLFAGIRKLPGGTWLRVREDGSIEERRYWELWEHVEPLTGVGDDEIAARLLAELATSVSMHKASDVPVGVFLSGGIDSSTNAALFSRGETSPVRTFAIGYEGDSKAYPSELPFARRMAREVGAEHHERVLSVDDLIEFLPKMIHLQDEPIADPVCVPLYYVSQLARLHGVTVCQVGEGSDELFWGYPAWKTAVQDQEAADRSPGFVTAARLLAARARGRTESWRYEGLERAGRGQPLFWGGFDEFTTRGKLALLAPRLRERFGSGSSRLSSWDVIAPIRKRFDDLAWEKTPLQWMSYLDLNLRLPELLLMRVDKMSMGVSLEGRVPFLDHRFVEFSMGIPQAVKTRGGVLKHILKKAVRGVIPDELIDRKKQGFGVPINEWMAGRLGGMMRLEIDTFCRDAELLDPAGVAPLFERRKGRQIWFLYNLALWWKHFIA